MEREPLRGSYTLTARLEIVNKVGMIGKVTSAIGKAGGDIGAIDLVEITKEKVVRDISFAAKDQEHGQEIIARVKTIPGIKVIRVSDRVLLRHLGGKIEIANKLPLKTRHDLSTAYTPGVARVCMAIYEDPKSVWALTIKRNAVAVVTDGTAVLGLGDIGPEAAMPVMEGKAMIFKEFGGIDAWPVCLKTKDPDEIIKAVKYMSPGFGGINLEDISAPRCFIIEEALKKELDIPVFHDDQHGTAVVVLAAVTNALKIVKKPIESLKMVVSGVGASGVACSKALMLAGLKNIIGCDRTGVIYKGRKENMNFMKEWFAEHTNPEGVTGTLGDAIEGADLFLGLSGPGVLTVKDLKKMNRDAIVFAMANPTPEIMPEEARPYVRIMATGRSDYPNQVNNALGFPGIFRGALDVQATQINEEMKLAAAYALAGVISSRELDEDYIIPSVFNRNVVVSVAREVARAARKTGVARRERKIYGSYQL
ncbi:MAG: NAD-dependent malic enzyme [Chloroflexi bacterium]|nr:NAD-dependent malic enzyme [Chloroflexota bacterium]